MPRSSTTKNENGVDNRRASSLPKTALLFVLLMLVFHVIFWLAFPVWKPSDPLRDFTTQATSYLLTRFNVGNTVNQYTISLRNDTWVVTQECTAINVFILYVSFVLAYSATLRSKGLALLVGVPFIFVSNTVRLLTLGLLTEYYPTNAHFFHDYVWETVFVLLVIAMWLFWIKAVVRHEEDTAISG
ncbi:archaeosortase/exosortase family protein [Geomonas paludis]|uniref:archaeosortase/exosortase family protein n=1 Tax=Geomonas paludis TaxID=2740185 RepID=UPI0035580A6B